MYSIALRSVPEAFAFRWPALYGALHRVLIVLGIFMALGVWALTISTHFGIDSYTYWSVDLSNPYQLQVGNVGAFIYSPAAAMLFAPFKLLPYVVFHALWTTLLVTTALWLTPAVLWAPAMFALLPEIGLGNVHLIMAGAIVVGLGRYGAAWSLPLVLKLTPGVGLLWHLARREWRALTMAALATATLVGLSFVFFAPLWPQYVDFLVASAGQPLPWWSIAIPLLPRLVAAVVLMVFAARTGRAWMVPIAVCAALPVLWWNAVPVFIVAALHLWLKRTPTALSD